MSLLWDERYQKQKPTTACWVLTANLHLLPRNNNVRSLDLACGLGANALLLAEHGFESHGWDNSAVALEQCQHAASRQGLTVKTLLRDVEAKPPPPNSFDIIVVSQFLHRPSCGALVNALRPHGILFYQTFHQNKFSNNGPTREAFLLEPNELLQLFGQLHILFYREDSQVGDPSAGLRDLSYLVAQKC